jgi:uncharacterized protein (DUF1684 family)
LYIYDNRNKINNIYNEVININHKMKTHLVSIFILISSMVSAQDFVQEINDYRSTYKKEFLASRDAPVKPEDIRFLDFYQPDQSFRVNATVVKTDLKPFLMMTHSGKTKEYKEYGVATFKISNKPFKLHIYRSLDLIKQDAKYNDYLFIPFKDATNGVETYGGGRYLEFNMEDIKDGVLVIDFNKAYNPYCAYSEGYSCPIPPEENHLDTEIAAGEKNFQKN